MRNLTMATVLGLAAVSTLGLSGALAGPSKTAPARCFSARDWNGWTVSPDGKSLYIRTGMRDIRRVDFAAACHAAQGIGVHLVTRIRGGDSICGPLDLDLKVSDGHGFAVPCIASKITPLTAEEAAALPKGLRP